MPIRALENETSEARKARAELLEASSRCATRSSAWRAAPALPAAQIGSTVRGSATACALPCASRAVRRPEHTLILLHHVRQRQEKPCPMSLGRRLRRCHPHLRQRVSFAVLVAGDAGAFAATRARAAGSTSACIRDGGLKRDFGFEDEAGAQQPGASVFRLGADGQPRHFYSVSAMITPAQFRGMDALSPFWSFLDLTPEGRGDFCRSGCTRAKLTESRWTARPVCRASGCLPLDRSARERSR
jgi:predicted dithiol-disulfide oxidoreductase (DUF899 family)